MRGHPGPLKRDAIRGEALGRERPPAHLRPLLLDGDADRRMRLRLLVRAHPLRALLDLVERAGDHGQGGNGTETPFPF